jgi:hypothetical protein
MEANQQLSKLVRLLCHCKRQLLTGVLTLALQRHALLCSPLEKLVAICEASIAATSAHASPLHVVGGLGSHSAQTPECGDVCPLPTDGMALCALQVGVNSELLKALVDAQKDEVRLPGDRTRHLVRTR